MVDLLEPYLRSVTHEQVRLGLGLGLGFVRPYGLIISTSHAPRAARRTPHISRSTLWECSTPASPMSTAPSTYGIASSTMAAGVSNPWSQQHLWLQVRQSVGVIASLFTWVSAAAVLGGSPSALLPNEVYLVELPSC